MQVKPVSEQTIKSYIATMQNKHFADNELQLAIAEDNLQQTVMLFQALASGLNLATIYCMSGTQYCVAGETPA